MSTRNPKWQKDEIILALDLYFNPNRGTLDSKNPKIVELSKVLNMLTIITDRPDPDTFRNPNAVALKLSNFRAIDPIYTSEGKKGMTGGSKLDYELFQKYKNDLEALQERAKKVMDIITDPEISEDVKKIEEDEVSLMDGAKEGKVIYKLHKVYERSRKIVKQKIKWALATYGKLTCEACDFDFEKRYGDIGKGFIECHHRFPLSKIKKDTITTIDNLALVCSNCHHMLHKDIDNLTVESLREILHR